MKYVIDVFYVLGVIAVAAFTVIVVIVSQQIAREKGRVVGRIYSDPRKKKP